MSHPSPMPFAQYFDRMHAHSEARSFVEKWIGKTDNALELFVENLPSVLERGLLVRKILLEKQKAGNQQEEVENAEEEFKDD